MGILPCLSLIGLVFTGLYLIMFHSGLYQTHRRQPSTMGMNLPYMRYVIYAYIILLTHDLYFRAEHGNVRDTGSTSEATCLSGVSCFECAMWFQLNGCPNNVSERIGLSILYWGLTEITFMRNDGFGIL